VNYALGRLAQADADVLLLNPDAQISAESVDVLHKSLRADPSLACVGPAQVDQAGRAAVVEWPFPSAWSAWREALGLGCPSGPAFVIGSVLLLRREAIEAVGPFDERFFLYAEETDWQRRALNAGFRSAVAHEVTAMHIGGATSSDSRRRETYAHASLEKYVRKHSGVLAWHVLRAGVVAGGLLRMVLRPHDATIRRRLRLFIGGPARAERRLRADPRSEQREGTS
jgi:GT2 family glycosyltransferase